MQFSVNLAAVVVNLTKFLSVQLSILNYPQRLRFLVLKYLHGHTEQPDVL